MKIVITEPQLRKLPATPSRGTKKFGWDQRVPCFGAYKSCTGRVYFVYQYRQADGKSRRLTIGTWGEFEVEDARDVAAAWGRDRRQGVDPYDQVQVKLERAKEDEGLLFGNFLESFYAGRIIDGKPVKADFKKAVDRDLVPHLADVSIANMSPKEIDAMLETLAKRSASAVRWAITNLKVIMNWAKRKRYIGSSPMDGYVTPKSNRRKRMLSRFELARFYEAATDISDVYGEAFLLLLYTAKRSTQVASMDWAEVDMDAGVWNIPPQKTKNGTPQTLILPRQAMALLQRVAPTVAQRRGRVFKSDGLTDGSGMIDLTHYGRSLLDASLHRRLELHAAANDTPIAEVAEFRIHDLRATIVSTLQRRPFSVSKTVNEAILHHITSKAGIQGVYQQHEYDDEVGDALQLWADHVDELISAPDAWPGGRDLPRVRKTERKARQAALRSGWAQVEEEDEEDGAEG